MNIRRYMLVLALSVAQFAAAQQPTQQQQQRSVQPIDRQVNAGVVANPQQISPQTMIQIQQVPANILVAPRMPDVDSTQIKPAGTHQEVSTWTLEPTPTLAAAGLSTTSPPPLKKLPPPASTWTLAPTVNPGDHGFSTTLPQSLSSFPPLASAWTLGPGVNATERELATASMAAASHQPPSGVGNPLSTQSATYQNASRAMISGSRAVPGSQIGSTSIGTGTAAPQTSPTTGSAYYNSTYSNRAYSSSVYPNSVSNETPGPVIGGLNSSWPGPATMGSALQSDPSEPHSLVQSYGRLPDPGLSDPGNSLTSTQMADSPILYGRHFERMDTLQGLTSPFASPVSAMHLGPEISTANYSSLRSRISTMRKSELSELPPELLHSPEVRRALRTASAGGQRGQRSPSCKLRAQCATLAAKSGSKSGSRISRASRSSIRLRLESALGN